MLVSPLVVRNTLELRQNGRYFTDDLFKLIFLNENCFISIQNTLKIVPMGLIDDNPINGLVSNR